MDAARVAELAFGLVTAGSTAATAYFAWAQTRQRVTVEWELNNYTNHQHLDFQFTLRNRRASAIDLWRADVVGLPVLNVKVANRAKGGWPAHATPLSIRDLPPGSAGSSTLTIEPDWVACASILAQRSRSSHIPCRIIIQWVDRSDRKRARSASVTARIAADTISEHAAKTAAQNTTP